MNEVKCFKLSKLAECSKESKKREMVWEGENLRKEACVSALTISKTIRHIQIGPMVFIESLKPGNISLR